MLLVLAMVLSVLPAPVFAADSTTATLVKDISALEVGDRVVIAAATRDAALGTNQKTNNREAVAVTANGETITLTDTVQVLTLEEGTKEGTYAFYTGSGYLYAAGTSKDQNGSKNNNYLKTEKELSDNSSFALEISAEGVATVTAQGENGCNLMRYNKTSALFTCYLSGQQDISIFKVDGDEPGQVPAVIIPFATPEAGEVEAGTEVAFSNGTDDAVYYKVNGAEGFVLYEGPVEVTEDTTFVVYAEKDGLKSEEVTFAYTVKVPAPEVVPVSTAVAGADGEQFTVKGVVTMVEGKNVYLQDATGGICVYMSATPEAKLGDTVIATGTKGAYRGMPQLSAGTYVPSEGLTLTAKQTTIGALTDKDLGTYVQLSGVEVTEVYDNNGAYATPNIKVTDGTDTIQIYKAVVGKTDGVWDVAVGDVIDVKAAVGTNNGTLQLRNTLASEITVSAVEPEPEYDAISTAVAGADGEQFTVKGVVTMVEGKNVYLQDATGGICVYMSATPEAKLGDTVIATGTKGAYRGMPQLSAGTYVPSEGLTLTAKQTTIGALTDKDLGTYVQLSGVEVTEVYDNNGAYATPNIKVTDGTDTIQIYKAVVGKTDGVWDVAVGDVIDVKAAVGTNNGTLQLRNTLASEITAAAEAQTEKLTAADQFVTGTYALVVSTGKAMGALDGTWVSAVEPTIEDSAVTDAKGGVWTLTVNGGTVQITDANGASIMPKGGNANGISSGSYDWAWTFDEATQTFTFAGQGGDTVKLASNTSTDPTYGGFDRFRAYKNSTISGNSTTYLFQFSLYPVVQEDSESSLPAEGAAVVIYNLSAQSVLAEEGDTQVINGASARIDEDKGVAIPANGGVVFTVESSGGYYRFRNETYGYLCSNGTGNNAFYSAEASDDADWTLTSGKKGGFFLESRTAKFNGKYSQYLEYYSDSFKTYSMNKVTDYDIYEFFFYPAAEDLNLTGGIVNAPAVDFGTVYDAYVGKDYTFSFTVDAVFGVEGELSVTVNGEALAAGEDGSYTVPSEWITGESLTVAVSGTDTKGVAISGEAVIPVKDEPTIGTVTPAANAQTDTDKRPVISAEIFNAGEAPVITMTVNGETVETVLEQGIVSYTPAEDMAEGRTTVVLTVERGDGKKVEKTWSFTVGKARYQLYFGQLHSHTTYSDGSGSLDSALSYIQNLPDSANVDFVAFTDHSNYFDASGAANPEGALYDMTLGTADSQTRWSEYVGAMKDFNSRQGDVIAVPGFEMTWSGGPGHINTFNTPGIVSRNNSTLNNKTGDAGMKAYYSLLSRTEGVEGISQFNHPGSTFGTFSDFAYWDAVIDSRIQLVEVGNGEGQIGAGGYYPSYEYYTMALDKGWHVAPTNNQDNHKGKWGNANDARDVIITDDFTLEGLYGAMRAMRMYATEDKNLEIGYLVNGQMMGSSITEVPEKLDIAVTVFDPDASDSISKVELIVNSGKVAHSWSDPADLADGALEVTLDPTYSYYYLRVTEGDGDLAVTAPVWVGESLKLGISSVVCGTSTPVTGEELTVTTTLFNSENSEAQVKSIVYTVGDKVIGTDTAVHAIPAAGTASVEFKYTPDSARILDVTATVIVELEGEEYTFSMDVQLDVQDAEKLVYIGIDASHFNEYVAGNYKDSMGNFGALAAEYSVRTVELKTSQELIAACSNPKYKALIMTAPSRRLADAQTDPRTYSAEEIAAIKAFNEAGGMVILAGWSDNYENYDVIQSNAAIMHMAAAQNAVLEALGSSLRIGDDATYDDVRSAADGVDKWRLYFSTYGDSFLTEGVEFDAEHPFDRLYTEVFSHYGGATVYTADGTLPATVKPVVFAHSTTYSVDVDKDGLGGEKVPKYPYAEGDERLMVMASEQLEGKGLIIVSGAAFMSNFEVQATIEDSGAEKNYSNYRICENLLKAVNPVTVTDIAEVRAQSGVGYKYTIEGTVTSNASGYDKDTAFFDCIYVQDATGGICCFPVAGNFKIGDKVRITGTTEFYQGEPELQVSAIEVIGEGTVKAAEITAAQLNDRSAEGKLVTVTGTVESFGLANGLVQTILVKDPEGNTARIFIDGYITTAQDVQNLTMGCSVSVTGLASYDDTFNAPEGPFPRIRVRDRADVVCADHVHTFAEGKVVEPTCLTDGYTEYACEQCGYIYRDTIVEAPGHVTSSEVVAPTHSTVGYTVTSCTRCDYSSIHSFQDALEHTFVIEVTRAATCTEDGLWTCTCECGESFTQVAEATGHDLKAPVCDGEYLITVCRNCGYEEKEAHECQVRDFDDLRADAWYHVPVDYILNEGIMIGTAEGKFSPDTALTRGQMVTILYRLAGEPEVEVEVPFTDVPENAFYADAVAWGYETGLVKGITDTEFAPMADVTRQQMATFLHRYAGLPEAAEGAADAFEDAGEIGNYAKAAMNWAVDAGILNGTTATTLAPAENTTRAQAATVIYRYLTAE